MVVEIGFLMFKLVVLYIYIILKETTKVSLRLDKILPITKNLKAYYRYMGSLTVPPCKEGVIWSIFNEYIPISAKQVSNLFQPLFSFVL